MRWKRFTSFCTKFLLETIYQISSESPKFCRRFFSGHTVHHRHHQDWVACPWWSTADNLDGKYGERQIYEILLMNNWLTNLYGEHTANSTKNNALTDKVMLMTNVLRNTVTVSHLNRSQNCRHIIRRTPSILKDVQTYTSISIYYNICKQNDQQNLTRWSLRANHRLKKSMFGLCCQWPGTVNSWRWKCDQCRVHLVMSNYDDTVCGFETALPTDVVSSSTSLWYHIPSHHRT